MDQLPVQWNEPATLGNLRDLAIRLDLRFGKIDTRFNKMDARLDKMDARLVKMEGCSDGLRSDLPTTIRHDVWASAAATMALNLAALGLVVSILK